MLGCNSNTCSSSSSSSSNSSCSKAPQNNYQIHALNQVSHKKKKLNKKTISVTHLEFRIANSDLLICINIELLTIL